MKLRTEADKLKISFDYCHQVMKEKAVSFYHAFSQLPEDMFSGVMAVYAFCRYADDVTDGDIPGLDQEETAYYLGQLKELLEDLYAGRLSEADYDHYPWLRAFKRTVDHFEIPINPFLAQVDGQLSDIDFQPPQKLSDLIHYSKLVAGSVGQMLYPILVKKEEKSIQLEEACLNLGVGMQITNILRDIGEDIRDRNRIYIPRSMLVEYDLTETDLKKLAYSPAKEPSIPSNMVKLWERLSDISTDFYQGITEHVDQFKKSAQLPLLASAYLYQGIEDAVRREDYNCFTKRCYTSKLERVRLINQARKDIKAASK